jgi:hypothetical protein
MSLTSPDFESGAYTNFATPAGVSRGKMINPMAEGSQPEEVATYRQPKSTRSWQRVHHSKVLPGRPRTYSDSCNSRVKLPRPG